MSTLTLPNGTVLTRVTRASCLARVAAIPLQSFEYSRTRLGPTGKRADCTGWVCYVWATPDEPPEIPGVWLNAYNTSSLDAQQIIKRIAWADLRPGDAIGWFGPFVQPDDVHHAAIWMGGDRRPDGRFHVVDHGSGLGPKDRWVQWNRTSTGWLHPDHLTPRRYVAITEGEEDMAELVLTPADQQALIYRELAVIKNTNVEGGPTLGEVNQLAATVKAIATDVAAIKAAVEATPPGGLTIEQVYAAVARALNATGLVVRTDTP